MSTIIINISKRSYSTRGRALGIAKQAISREINVLTNANGDPLFWTLDNVVVEEAEDGWRWHVEIDMPSTDSAMDEIEAQEQEEAPRELTVEQALEIAAQQTEAVEEEFNAVEARHRAEAELNKVKDMTSLELSMAASTGKSTLAETIDRMETALRHLKEYQREYKAEDPKEDAFYMAERLRRASNEIHGYLCTSLAMELATTAGALEQLAKAACRLDMDGE